MSKHDTRENTARSTGTLAYQRSGRRTGALPRLAGAIRCAALLLCGCLNLWLASSVNAGPWETQNNACHNLKNAPANNITWVEVESIRPFASVPVNGVLGRAKIRGPAISCVGEIPPPVANFALQIRPGTGEAGTVCGTGLDGVGVRFIDTDGRAILCSGREEFRRFVNVQPGQVLQLDVPGAMEFIRTKAMSSLKPGRYHIKLSPSFVIDSYWPGYTSSTVWSLTPQVDPNSPPLVLSQCSLAGVTTTVDFKTLTLAQIQSSQQEKPFTVSIGGCGDQTAAEVINQYGSFSFSSATILADGSLGNESCADCATGLAIEVLKQDGAKVDLNRLYKLSLGQFAINSETVTHFFRARLKATPSTLSSGAIKSVLVVVLTQE